MTEDVDAKDQLGNENDSAGYQNKIGKQLQQESADIVVAFNKLVYSPTDGLVVATAMIDLMR